MMDQQSHENREMSRALYEELAALKIRIAFAEIDEDELAEFDRDLSSVSEGGYSEAAQKRTLKLIERKLNKRLRRRFIAHTLPHTLHVVTVVLLLFFIGLTTAVATVRPVRLRVLDFIAKIEEGYSEISFFNDIDNAVVPSEWKGKYYPSFIPVEFTLSHIDEFYNAAYYISKDERVLQFHELDDSVYSNVDIDEGSAFDITINGYNGIVMTDNESTTITWCINDIYLDLYYSGNLDEAKRIAESVQLIQ